MKNIIKLCAAVLACFLLALAPAAKACPVCQSPRGVEVRKQILDSDFVRNVSVTLAPFLILGLAVTRLRFSGRKRRRHND